MTPTDTVIIVTSILSVGGGIVAGAFHLGGRMTSAARNMTAGTASLREGMEHLKSAVEKLDGNVGKVVDKLNVHDTRLALVESRVSDMRDDVDRLKE